MKLTFLNMNTNKLSQALRDEGFKVGLVEKEKNVTTIHFEDISLEESALMEKITSLINLEDYRVLAPMPTLEERLAALENLELSRLLGRS